MLAIGFAVTVGAVIVALGKMFWDFWVRVGHERDIRELRERKKARA